MPNFNQAGSYAIQWTAIDDGSPALTAQATTAVLITDVNRTPLITAPAIVSAQEFVNVTITGSATDPDAENVTLSQTNNAAFLAGPSSAGPSLNPSITLSGTPNFAQSGSYTINWAATDSHSPAGTRTAVTAVTVGGPGRSPVITVSPSASATEGVPFSITATAGDPDGQDVTLCVTARPAFLLGPTCAGPSLNPVLTLSGTPGPNDAGSYTINWSATDSGTPANTSFATTALTVGDSNRPPVLDPPSNMTVDEGAVATQQLTGSDPEGAFLTFSKVGPSPLFMVVSAAGLVTLSPGFTDAGSYTATVRVSDGAASDSKSFTIAVADVHRCPVASAGGPYLGVRGSAVAFDGTGSSSPDGAPLTYAWDFGDGTTGSGATTSHVYSFAANFTVSLTVDDGTCQATDVTTASIDNEYSAFAFTTGGNGTVSLGSGKPFTCAQVEPLGGSFNLADVNLATIKMVSAGTGAVSEIPAVGDKTSVGGDKNGNGQAELGVCFAKADLRQLFSLLPAGRNDVTVFIDGALTTGGVFRAELLLTVKATGGALAASISPNPLNPSARLTFETAKAGAVTVQMFDLNGRLVRTYLDERQAAAGYHDVTIDGRTETGGRVPSGVYFVKIWT
ncbi:MAG TPA: PKD domain-containing protein, partial [Candidatus Eisenbacteria bacterium]|nr:PKD domain-containing protein [Candidatus Eisenbacteria bacterium]